MAHRLKQNAKHPATPEAKAALAAVAPLIATSTQIFTARDIATTLYAVNGFGIDAPGMTELLSAMPRHILACRGGFNAQEVSMSLYGLRGCKGR